MIGKIKFRKNSNLVIAAIFISAFLFIFSSYSEFKILRSIRAKNIQEKISALEDEIENDEKTITKALKNSNPVTLKNELKEISTFSRLIIFKDDKPIFWNNNEYQSWKNIMPEKTISAIFDENGLMLAKFGSLIGYKYLISYPIYKKYKINNEYLINKPSEYLQTDEAISFLSCNKCKNKITDKAGNYLFSLEFNAKTTLTKTESAILFFGFVLLVFLLILLIYNYIYHKLKWSQNIKNLSFLAVLMSLYMIISFIWLPPSFEKITLFSPSVFAISTFNPSLGHSFVQLLLLTSFLVIINIHPFSVRKYENSKLLKIIVTAVSFGFIAAINLAFITVIKSYVSNSTIAYNINSIESFNLENITGLLLMSLLAISYSLIVFLFIKLIKKNFNKKLWLFISNILVVLATVSFIDSRFFIIYFTSLFLFNLLIYSTTRTDRKLLFINFVLSALIISFILNLSINIANRAKEKASRATIVHGLALNQDPEAEYLFTELEKKIYQEGIFETAFINDTVNYDEITKILLEDYFGKDKYWEKFDFQITICDQAQTLIIKPSNYEISCKEFFYNNLIKYGKLTSNKNLYRLNYGSGQINYLGLLQFKQNFAESIIVHTIYIEINSKIKRDGFTKLLSPSGLDPFEKIRDYSLAKYVKGNLVESYGEYPYSSVFYNDSPEKEYFVNKNGFNHLIYNLNDNESYVLSIRNTSSLSRISSTSYIFILILFLMSIIVFSFNKQNQILQIKQSFAVRLQVSFIGITLMTMVVIALLSAYYINQLNSQKNNLILKSLAESIKTEFNHKFENYTSVDESMKDYLSELSMKFSGVFNTDINIYSTEGILLSTTKPDVFNFHLIGNTMHPLAVKRVIDDKSIFFINQECIGELDYSSAYIPFYNQENKLLAYINLPYFSQQDKLKKEVSSFLTTLLNIYTLIIVLSILVILLITSYLSRPLRMIRDKMQSFVIGKKNEYIVWEKEDEIGDLVKQYNRMVDELAVSAEILAKTERESAWQEMARQVAHEIKNPLTPMKLSVQYLLKAMNDNAPNIEERVRNLSKTLIQQIDTLADIANAFSDFAKLPLNDKMEVNLVELINNSINIHKAYENIEIIFEKDSDLAMTKIDESNMLRVFNNLIKNALQSIPEDRRGLITIRIEEINDRWQIMVKDNGCGISEDKIDKIFVPNFTTKSSGTGLGLAMSKNIVLANSGLIYFETQENIGTKFFVELPKLVK